MNEQLKQWGSDEQAAGEQSANAWQEFFTGKHSDPKQCAG